MFNKMSFDQKFNYEYIYPTTHDAILHICHRTNVAAAAAASTPATAPMKTSPIYHKRFLPSQRHSQLIEQHILEVADELTGDEAVDDLHAATVPLAQIDVEFVDETQANNKS
jgi:hypothetical protein